jgi:hypothetical protein
MDYEMEFDTGFDVDSIIADVDVDFEDDALTLPEDDQFDDEDY